MPWQLAIEEKIATAQTQADPTLRKVAEREIANELKALQAEWRQFLLLIANVKMPDAKTDEQIKQHAAGFVKRRLLILQGPAHATEKAMLQQLATDFDHQPAQPEVYRR
jgi:hypothetical protein